MSRQRTPGAAPGAVGRVQEILVSGRDDPENTPVSASIQPAWRLAAEWLATPDLNSRQYRQLAELGVSWQAIHRCGGLGWARIATIGSLYAPSGDGDVAAIQPVWACPPSIYNAVESPRLYDLIAWRPSVPETWWYRYGLGHPVIGEDLYLDAIETGGPLTVFSTPLEWLQAEGQGCVFLTNAEARWAAEGEAVLSPVDD